MRSIHIRHVLEATRSALRERAARYGRSVPREPLDISHGAAAEPASSQAYPPIQLVTTSTGKRTTWRREDIYDDDTQCVR